MSEHLVEHDVTEAASAVVNPELRSARMTLRELVREARDYRALRATRYGIVPIAIIGGIGAFQAIDSAAFINAAPEIRRALEVNIDQIINALVTIGIVSIIGLLLVGYYADRIRRSSFVWIGTLISGVFALCGALTSTIVPLGFSRVVDDTSASVSGVPLNSLIADYYPPEVRGKAFALLDLWGNSSSVIVPVFAGGLIALGGWRLPFIVVSVPLVVLALIARAKLRDPVRGFMERKALGLDDEQASQPEEPVSFGESWRSTWAIRTVRRLFIATVIDYGGLYIAGVFFIFYLSSEYHLGAFQRGIFFSLVALPAVFGGILGGGMVDVFTRSRPSRLFAFLGLLGASGAAITALMGMKPNIVLMGALYGVSAFFAGMVSPAEGAILAQVTPSHIRSTAFVLRRLSLLPGLIILVPIGESVVGRSGVHAAYYFAAPFILVGALIRMSAGAFYESDMRSAFAAAVAGEEWRAAKREGRGKLLVCRDVDVEYSGVQVLFGVDFDVEEGEIIALLGTNGAGKSTLLRAISGTQEASSGAVVFDGRDITHMPPHEIAQRRVIHMPGGKGVFPGLSVRENLLLGLWMADDRADADERLAEVFEVFPSLKDRLDVVANALSGGEQQQLSLAQAFMGKPRLLLIDELSLGLSPAVVGQLLEIVREIHRRGTTIVIVEQSVNVALALADKAIFMEKGEVRFVGATADLLRRSDILRAVYVKGTGSLTDVSSSALRSERERRALDLHQSRPILEVNSLFKRYGGVVAVDDVSLSLREGESLGLIGPNGSGKTTTFDLISGYQAPDSGTIVYDGVDVTGLDPAERAKRKLVRRFQDARLFPSLTVFETLLVALDQQAEVRSTAMHAIAVPSARRAERRLRLKAERLIELLDLGAYRDKFVRELSTGLRRIVDLACVLAAEPRVLLLDEPSSGIAQAEAEGLAPLLGRIRHETGCSLLIIEHDMPLISAVADELIAMELGGVVTRGTPEDVLNDERVIESYLGGSQAAIRRSGVLPS